MAKIPTTKLTLVKKNASDTEGYIKVKVYIPETNKPKFKSTKYKVPAKMWIEDEQRVKSSYNNAVTINREIEADRDSVIEAFEHDLKKGVKFTAAHIESRLKGNEANGDFLQFFSDYITYLRTRCSEAYCDHFEVEYNKLSTFAGDNGLSFSDVTTEFLRRYETSLTCAATTKNTKFKRIKEVVNDAISRGHIELKQIAGYKWPSYEDPGREYLTLAETEKIADEIYGGKFDDDETLRKVACYFLVECYGGVRISDWRRFKVEQLVTGKNFKCRAKKNGEPIYLPLAQFKRLARILDYIQANKILFDITDQAANRLLKIVASQVKIKKELTSHVGRHTFGTILGELRWTTSEIAEAMGISENTAKTYVKATREKVKIAAERNGGI